MSTNITLQQVLDAILLGACDNDFSRVYKVLKQRQTTMAQHAAIGLVIGKKYRVSTGKNHELNDCIVTLKEVRVKNALVEIDPEWKKANPLEVEPQLRRPHHPGRLPEGGRLTMLRLVEWVPGRFWLLNASEQGFTPECEVQISPAVAPRIPPYRVSGAEVGAAMRQGVEAKILDNYSLSILLEDRWETVSYFRVRA